MLSSVVLVVKPSKIIFLIENTIPQKEGIILLYNGYHSIPQIKYYSVGVGTLGVSAELSSVHPLRLSGPTILLHEAANTLLAQGGGGAQGEYRGYVGENYNMGIMEKKMEASKMVEELPVSFEASLRYPSLEPDREIAENYDIANSLAPCL